ncbi:MAG: CHAT domain-containing protein, partial [Pirellulales bacterium]
MVRTIVQIHSDGTTQHALLSYPLGDFDDDDIETPLSVDIEATKSIPPPETSVLRVGTALADDLSTNNAIRQAIQAAMAHPPHVVCFDARSSAARDFPWEALRYGQQFLALHKDFTVARLARPTNNWHDRLFVAPLKMLVVLAAAGPVLPGVATNCTREWLELSRALAKSKRPLKVTVLVAEPALKQQIEAWPKPAHLELTVDLLSSREHLRDALGEGPNILHIFCHGTANRPQLQLATPADMAAGLGKGSIVLEANQLSQIQGLIDSAWLVTLNCCESALSSREVHSLADALASAGFP